MTTRSGQLVTDNAPGGGYMNDETAITLPLRNLYQATGTNETQAVIQQAGLASSTNAPNVTLTAVTFLVILGVWFYLIEHKKSPFKDDAYLKGRVLNWIGITFVAIFGIWFVKVKLLNMPPFVNWVWLQGFRSIVNSI